MNVWRFVALAIAVAVMCVPSAASAQGAGSTITGVVRDTSGGVLPGVTVEAASPALIEKVRSAVTDAEGLYRLVDLRPGEYTVTFTLPGFNTFRREGMTLGQILIQRMDEIEKLAKKAEAAPGRKPEAIRARLAEQVAALLETSERFDSDRLNQEAIMIATRADIREELDRIASHVAQAREMIGKGGPVGRRLDFLAQEFNREVNTCCSKSNDLELTQTGLEMKNVVEQFREQVQNLE